jgi:hypothetical protein
MLQVQQQLAPSRALTYGEAPLNGKIFLSLLLLAAPLPGLAEQLVPAGSIIQCTVSEPKISSKTEKVGDPILCQVSHVELYGRSSFPYGSYMVGHFEEYKDPGHFVGKGWMELKFDRLVIQPDTIIPIEARVVAAPKYSVDSEGRIHGSGHPVRDTIEWLIPVLWPIDLINLPRRGPRPVLKPESRLTLKVLDDFGIPSRDEYAMRQPGLIQRPQPAQQSYAPQQQYAPPQQSYAPPQQPYYPQPQPSYAPMRSYAPPPPPTQIIYQISAPQPVVQYVAPQPVFVQTPVVYAPPPPAYVPYGYVRYAVPGYRYGPY